MLHVLSPKPEKKVKMFARTSTLAGGPKSTTMQRNVRHPLSAPVLRIGEAQKLDDSRLDEPRNPAIIGAISAFLFASLSLSLKAWKCGGFLPFPRRQPIPGARLHNVPV
jgi:hypothetical protein